MDAQKIAARFVAFTAFLNQRKQPVLLEHAGRYARRHWKKYLPYASENLAHFLTKTPEGLQRRKTEKRNCTPFAHVSGSPTPSLRQAWIVSNRNSMAHSH